MMVAAADLVLGRLLLLVVLDVVEGVHDARLAQPVLHQVRVEQHAVVARQAAPRDRVEKGARGDEIVGQQLAVEPARALRRAARVCESGLTTVAAAARAQPPAAPHPVEG